MTKNQHFIPRFYQKYWECEKQGHLWSYDKKLKTICKRPITANCSEDFLYEADVDSPDNAMENWFGKFETLYSGRYKKLINSRTCISRLSEQDKNLICKFFVNFSARNPKNLYKNPENNLLASHFTLGIDDKKTDRRSINLLLAISEGGMGDILSPEKEILGDFEETLCSCKIQLLYTNEPKIVFCDSIVKEVSCAGEYFFPLCPNMVSRFSFDKNSEDRSVRQMTDEEYRRFILLYSRSRLVKRIYAQSKDVLERITRNAY